MYTGLVLSLLLSTVWALYDSKKQDDNSSNSGFKSQQEYLQHAGNRAPREGNDFASLIEALQHVQKVQKQMDDFAECKKNDTIVLHITFDHSRWNNEAMLVLEVANLLTLLWRRAKSVVENDTLLYAMVRSNVLFSSLVYGSVICFERNQYKHYERFCPYAYRDKKLNKNIHIMDISVEHDYLTSHETIWWRLPREKAIKINLTQLTEHYNTRFNSTAEKPMENVSVPVLQRVEDGLWTSPYFDCFGGKSWMVTYLAPFFNESNQFLGVVSIDIQLNDIDINQCDSEETKPSGQNSGKLTDFMGTHRCKKSTKCVNIPDQGFKRGSYWCVCAKGFYPAHDGKSRFNGSIIEAEHDKKNLSLPNNYDNGFECLPCSEGCLECIDGRPCQYTVYIIPRILLLVINALTICLAVGFGLLVVKNREAKVFSSSSPLFLLIILSGAFLMYIGFISQFPSPPNSLLSCIAYPWLQNIGFALAYGSLTLKTWRVYRTFQVRSAHKVQITDIGLLRHLAVIVAFYIIVLLVWTLTTKSFIESTKAPSGLKYKRCLSNWLEYAIAVFNVIMLLFALWLCYRVRKAPSTYSENRFISWAIYNAVFVTCFFTILRGLTRKNTNPDIKYAVEFVFIHMTTTVMVLLIFIPKCIILRKIRRRGVSTSFSSSGKKRSGELSPNGTQLYVTDMAVMERENEDLKAEVKRLSSKVASLQSRMMKDRNKHIKTSGLTTWKRERSSTKDTDEPEPADLNKISPSPISRFLSAHV